MHLYTSYFWRRHASLVPDGPYRKNKVREYKSTFTLFKTKLRSAALGYFGHMELYTLGFTPLLLQTFLPHIQLILTFPFYF
jgi:hypothetical protein